MQALQPIPLAASTQATVNFDGTVSPQPVKGLIVQNQSGFNLTLDGPFGSHVIGPWINDYIPVITVTSKTVTVLPNSSQIAAVPNPQLLVTLVWNTDPTPVGYPAANPMGLSASIQGTIQADITNAVNAAVSGSVGNASGAALLYNNLSISIPGSSSWYSPIMAVGDYSHIGFQVNTGNTATPVNCTINFFTDSAGTQRLILGTLSFEKNSTPDSYVSFPACAPYAQIVIYNRAVTSISGAMLTVQAFQTSFQVTPAALLGSTNLIGTDQDVANGATLTVGPTGNIGGPAVVTYHGTGPYSLQLNRWNSLTWEVAMYYTLAAGQLETPLQLLLPTDDWTMSVINGSGATNHYWLTVTAAI